MHEVRRTFSLVGVTVAVTVMAALGGGIVGSASADPMPTSAGALDRITGLANEATGSVKQGLGDLTDDRGLKAEGKVQELKGRVQQGIGETKDAAETARSRF